jgi:trehalose/maltose transport system permease protein
MTTDTLAPVLDIVLLARQPRSDLANQRLRAAMVFLLPMLLTLAVVAGWPLARSIYFSFTDTSLTNLYGGHWVGFANYLSWATIKSSGKTIYFGVLADPVWWNAVWNTVRFAVVSVTLEALLGMGVALMLNAEFPGRGIVRAAILIPWAIPTIVSAKMWAWMLNDQFGIINDIGLRLGLLSEKVAWTANDATSMIAVLVVDIWKTTPFMALLILAGLQMIPKDIYEAADVDGVHPVKQFFRITLPLVRPALMVAVIFRLLDAMRIFDLVSHQDHERAGARKPVRLRQVRLRLDRLNAAVPDPGRVRRDLYVARPGALRRRRKIMDAVELRHILWTSTKWTVFYAAVAVLVIVSVFPFYYAILTSFKTGTELFNITYLPTSFTLDNYRTALFQGSFMLNFLNSIIVSAAVVIISLLMAVTAAYALSRVRFRGRTTILMIILSVSMFPQIAVLAGLFELIRYVKVDDLTVLGLHFGKIQLYNTSFAVIFADMIFTLPFTVWVLTTFMRDLPVEIEEAAIVDGASPWTIIRRVFLPLMWPALVTTGLLAFIAAWNEFLFALTFLSSNTTRTVTVAIAMLTGSNEHEIPWGVIMAASVMVTVPLVVLVLIFQRKIISGLTAGGVKG